MVLCVLLIVELYIFQEKGREKVGGGGLVVSLRLAIIRIPKKFSVCSRNFLSVL